MAAPNTLKNIATLFITYNPKVEAEQSLAIRMHSIGAINGFRMYLPDRYDSEAVLSDETKRRIDSSNYIILFALTPHLQDIVKQEIEYAYQHLKDKSRIIVIYSTRKNLKGSATEHFTEIYHNIDEESADEVVERIFRTIFDKQQETYKEALARAKEQKLTAEVKRLKSQKESQNALTALLGIGLFLAILANIKD